MSDVSRWLRALRNQKKELQAEFERTQQEYEAALLVERKHSEWLSEKLIEAQAKCRLLTYEIEKKEVIISDLQSELRGKTQFRRSAPKKEVVHTDVAGGTCRGDRDCAEHGV